MVYRLLLIVFCITQMRYARLNLNKVLSVNSNISEGTEQGNKYLQLNIEATYFRLSGSQVQSKETKSCHFKVFATDYINKIKQLQQGNNILTTANSKIIEIMKKWKYENVPYLDNANTIDVQDQQQVLVEFRKIQLKCGFDKNGLSITNSGRII